MRESNLKRGKELANFFNKDYGLITYSGTLAIELALSSLLKENDNILVSSEVCYSIINTILKLKMNPIIVCPQNEFFLTDNDISNALKEHKIDCILLVHQFGILNNIDLKKYKEKGIKIIEDVAQAWNISGDKYKVGINSDIVVTSFGKTKPLSYGIGGGLFFNKQEIINDADFCDNESRANISIMLSYLYPLCEQINFEQLINKANSIVLEQKEVAKKYCEILSSSNDIGFFDVKEFNQNVWHRFPIWITNDNKFNKILNYLEDTTLEYQLPHKIHLVDLKKHSTCKKVGKNKVKKNTILLRTRNVNIKNQIEILKILIKM